MVMYNNKPRNKWKNKRENRLGRCPAGSRCSETTRSIHYWDGVARNEGVCPKEPKKQQRRATREGMNTTSPAPKSIWTFEFLFGWFSSFGVDSYPKFNSLTPFSSKKRLSHIVVALNVIILLFFFRNGPNLSPASQNLESIFGSTGLHS